MNWRCNLQVYHNVRDMFGLSAQLAIHAIRRVSGNRKTAKKDGKPVSSFAPTSVTYDTRIFSFREKDWTVSLTTTGGRERFVLAIGNYQLGLLKGQNPKTATLCKRKDGSYYLNIQLESQPAEPPPSNHVLGCGLSRTDIAVTSDGDTFSGKQITKVRNHYAAVESKYSNPRIICVILVGALPTPGCPHEAGVGKERHYPYIFLRFLQGLLYPAKSHERLALHSA